MEPERQTKETKIMGYTHYIQRDIVRSSGPATYGRFTNGVEKIFAEAKTRGIEIGDAFGETATPEITETRVAFNGMGDDAHETFSWDAVSPRQPMHAVGQPMLFDFCKTALKPYDTVVVAVLLWLKDCYTDAVEISSDGYWSEWYDGRDLFRTVFGFEAEAPFELEVTT
jgi:hypothetical protein